MVWYEQHDNKRNLDRTFRVNQPGVKIMRSVHLHPFSPPH